MTLSPQAIASKNEITRANCHSYALVRCTFKPTGMGTGEQPEMRGAMAASIEFCVVVGIISNNQVIKDDNPAKEIKYGEMDSIE